jgi:uncharacterized membrane protein
MFARTWLDRGLTVVIVLIVLASVWLLLDRAIHPRLNSEFTEFYLLNTNGKAGDYPTDLQAGQEGDVLVGIVNHEKADTSYRLEVFINGEPEQTLDDINLTNEEKWEQEVSFVPDTSGQREEVEFQLFKSSQSEAYLTLHLWVNVAQ